MKTVFADTLYWVAMLNPRDRWHGPASRATARLGKARLVTTEGVLAEFLTFMSGYGPEGRRKAAEAARRLLARADVEVVEQTHGSFLAALDLYERRPDKGYSLTDCDSMQVMRERHLSEVLTDDEHFVQEGFTLLLHDPA